MYYSPPDLCAGLYVIDQCSAMPLGDKTKITLVWKAVII